MGIIIVMKVVAWANLKFRDVACEASQALFFKKIMDFQD